MSLRGVALTLTLALFVACGGGAHKPTLPNVTPAPGDDLARAQAGATPGADGVDDPRLGTGGETDPRVHDLDTIRIGVIGRDAAGEPELAAVAAATLLQEGTAQQEAGQLEPAITTWRRLVTDFPESKYAPIALWDIAAVQEKQGDPDAEITTLRELVKSYPLRREAVEAQLYIAALQSERDQWAAARDTLEEALARNDLTFADRIEALARKGYVVLELDDVAAADAALTEAIAIWRKAPRIPDTYFIAMAHYYRGEVAHHKFVASPIRKVGTTAELHADLEAREKLAAEAYDRWKEALDFQHAYWSTASGYQMSQIFVEFWRATVTAPYPTDLDVGARTGYVAEVHARVRDHLEKALEGHRMNVELGAAFQVKTVWAEASKERAAEIMTLLAQDAGGRYVTPAP
jgi:tetratricopeptide (TPR) repeat protein